MNKTRYQFFAVDRTLRDDTFILTHRGNSVANNGSIVDSSGFLLGRALGGFDIAGCKGVPVLREKIFLEDNFVHVVRPERPATGGDKTGPYYDTVSLKWLEHPQRSDHPQNDFTLENNSAWQRKLR